MKKTKEYKMSVVLSSVALVLLCVALIVGVVKIDTSIERICFFLGVSLNCLGFVLWTKSKENDN